MSVVFSAELILWPRATSTPHSAPWAVIGESPPFIHQVPGESPPHLVLALVAGEMGMSKSNGQDRKTPMCDLSVEIVLSAVEGNRRDVGRGTHLDGGEELI